MFDDFDRLGRGAIFSPCEKYRYLLWRKWSDAPLLVAVLLNPSTATAEQDDPTVARCTVRAKDGGYGGLVVTNLFAFRATDPLEMKRAINAVGEHNDAAIRFAASRAGIVVCGWGAHGKHRARGSIVLRLLKDYPLWAWATTKDGCPGHPLYLRYGKPLVPLNEAARKVAA